MTSPPDLPIDGSLADVLPDLISTSPHLRTLITQRLEDLITLTFDHVEEAIELGDPDTRAAMLKMILPLVIKVKKDTEDTGTDLEATRAELQSMFREMGEGLGRVDDSTPREAEGPGL